MIHAIYFQSWNYTSACLGWVSMPVTNTLNCSPCCLLLLRAQTAAGKWVFMIYNCPIIIIFNRHIMMNERSSLFSRRDCHEISSTTCEHLSDVCFRSLRRARAATRRTFCSSSTISPISDYWTWTMGGVWWERQRRNEIIIKNTECVYILKQHKQFRSKKIGQQHQMHDDYFESVFIQARSQK